MYLMKIPFNDLLKITHIHIKKKKNVSNGFLYNEVIVSCLCEHYLYIYILLCTFTIIIYCVVNKYFCYENIVYF